MGDGQRQKGGFVMSKNLKVRAIFDNAGGVTLQLGDWAHYYCGYDGYIEVAAKDYKLYVEAGNTDGWDGHQDEAAELDPSYDDIRNGCYRVMDSGDIQTAIDDPDFETGWINIRDFINALK